MEQLVGFLGILIVFGAIIAVHEFGHFIVAKRSGMGVHEFSMGLGPALFKKQIGETLYAIRAVPFGGFVRIAGMEPGEEDAPNGFEMKPFYAKFLTILAGSAMNFVLAFLIFLVIGMAIGRPIGKTVIAEVIPDSPAAVAGIQPGDRIVEINGTPDPDVVTTVQLIRGNPDGVQIVVEREGERIPYTVTPAPMPGETNPIIGIQMQSVDIVYHRLGVLESIKEGLFTVFETTRQMLLGIVALVTGNVPAGGVLGPVGIMRATHDFAKDALVSIENLVRFLTLFALISMNIGLINLLPIPALDGSRLVFLTIERLRGKPFNKEKEALVHMVGLVLLLGLILLVTGKDVLQWIRGISPFDVGR